VYRPQTDQHGSEHDLADRTDRIGIPVFVPYVSNVQRTVRALRARTVRFDESCFSVWVMTGAHGRKTPSTSGANCRKMYGWSSCHDMAPIHKTHDPYWHGTELRLASYRCRQKCLIKRKRVGLPHGSHEGAVVARPAEAGSCSGIFAASTMGRTARTNAPLAFAVLTMERNAA
jgi:hypothetical protein